MKSFALFALVVSLLAGCTGRHVVVAPESMAGLNDADWTVTSAPVAASESE